ncbi:hypothetical protein [Pimelobacter simplex]|uniref:hypothetical protein n=1 Tax=Nocardioides simplex TaxID=2045 RepID=UPI00214FDC82|nr:hypothetical protein [Pimelobacter simplex]UUW88376.1 hypothetical protein M0M43_21890 [Pimelobacter simplex]UUW97880.1 hypothetical protein M0M48_10535 [Pimelobacter simplex]
MPEPGKTTIINSRVHRPPASATWQHEHRWGPAFGDSTTLSVVRTDGGPMRIRYGNESVELRAELVPVFVEMVAAAAAWTDEQAVR